jgi:fructose-1-phosphate kinase PfkB-like protein
VAGFVAALLRGLSLKDCLRWAAAAGAANTANFIPGEIDADHWRRLRRQIKLKKL